MVWICLQEPAESLGIARHLIAKKFQGIEAMQAGVFRLENHSHPTIPDLLDDAVMRDVWRSLSQDARPTLTASQRFE